MKIASFNVKTTGFQNERPLARNGNPMFVYFRQENVYRGVSGSNEPVPVLHVYTTDL